MPTDSFTRRTFPRLTIWCLRQKINCSADIFSELDSLVFQFGGEKSSADNFGMEHLSYFDSFDFRRKKQNARQTIFRGLTLLLFISTEIFKTKIRELAAWRFSFSFLRRILPTEKFDDGVRIRLDKILRIMILKIYNGRNEWLAHNKNYMSSLAAEGVRNGVLASAAYRSTVGRSEFQPCI